MQMDAFPSHNHEKGTYESLLSNYIDGEKLKFIVFFFLKKYYPIIYFQGNWTQSQFEINNF